MGTILFQILSTHCSNPESEQKQSRNQKHIIEQGKHTDYVNQIALILLFRQDPKELGDAFLNMNIDNQNES